MHSKHSDSKFDVLNIIVGAAAVTVAILIGIITTTLTFFCMSVAASSNTLVLVEHVYYLNRISCNRSDKPKGSNTSEFGDNVFIDDDIKERSNYNLTGMNIA